MKLFNFNKNKSKDKSKQPKQNKGKKSVEKAKFGLFKNKDDFIGRSGIGAAVEQAIISVLQSDLTDDDQPYIAIDEQHRLIYLIALTNDLMKDSMFEKDSEALGSLQAATENSNKNSSNKGDVPGSVYNASFPSDITPQANSEGEVPLKQLVFLPTVNTLNELETIAGPDQEYEIVSMPSDISDSNYLEYIKEGKINLPILDATTDESEDSVQDINDHLIKVTISGFKDFVKENTTLDSTNSYENFDDDTDQDETEDEELSDDESASSLLEDDDELANENGDDSALPSDDFDEQDLDDDDGSDFNDPFNADDGLDDDLPDDPVATDDTNKTDDKEPDSNTDDGLDTTATDLDDEFANEFDDDDDLNDDDLKMDDDDYDDDLDLDNVSDTDDELEPKEAPKADESKETKPVKDESANDDSVDDDLDELNDLDDDNLDDLNDEPEQADEQASETAPETPETPKAPEAETKPETDTKSETEATPEVHQEAAGSQGSVEPQVSTSAPVVPETAKTQSTTVQQQNQDKRFIKNVTDIRPTESQTVVPSNQQSKDETFVDVTNPEISLAQIDPSIKKMHNLTETNRKARAELRDKYSKHIDEWLARNLQVPVLYVKDSAKFGKKFLIEQNADNELLRKDVESQRAMIKTKLMNQIDQILDGLTDPTEFDQHFPQVAEKLRSKFLNKQTMKQEQINLINEISQGYAQLHEQLVNAAIDAAEKEFKTKYIPQRDQEINGAESKVKQTHQKAHSKAIDEILEKTREKAMPLVDEQVKDIISGSQSLVDSAALTISSQVRTYSNDLYKTVRIQTEMDNTDNHFNTPQGPEQNVQPETPDSREQEGMLYQKQQDLENAQQQIAELQREKQEKTTDIDNLKAIIASSHSRESELLTKIQQYQQDIASIQAEKAAAAQKAESYQQTNDVLLNEITNVQNHGSKGKDLDFSPEVSYSTQESTTPVATPEPELTSPVKPKPVTEPEREHHAPKSSPAHAPQL